MTTRDRPEGRFTYPDANLTIDLALVVVDGLPEVTGYAVRTIDGEPLSPEVRREVERGLDAAAAELFASWRVQDRRIPFGPGRITFSTGDDSVTFDVKGGAITRSYADPDGAKAEIVEDVRRARRRRKITPEFLAQVADVYMSADDRAPTKRVAETFHVEIAQASKYVARARAAGLIPPRGN